VIAQCYNNATRKANWRDKTLLLPTVWIPICPVSLGCASMDNEAKESA